MFLDRRFDIRGETQISGGEPGLEQSLQTGLLQGRHALAQRIDRRLIEIKPDDLMPDRGQTSGRHGAEMPYALDADPHSRAPNTHSFA